MWVVLHGRDYDRWLSCEVTEQPPVGLLRPFEPEYIQVTPANQEIGKVRNNGPEVLNRA